MELYRECPQNRINSHVFLWSLIIAGIGVIYGFIPQKNIIVLGGSRGFILIALIIFFVYHLLSAIYYHFYFFPLKRKLKAAIHLHVYGKTAHPTCTTLAVFGWIIFFYQPEMWILVANIWTTIVIVAWIRIEKSFFSNRRSTVQNYKPEPE